jgi:hypothetical protein
MSYRGGDPSEMANRRRERTSSHHRAESTSASKKRPRVWSTEGPTGQIRTVTVFREANYTPAE